MSLPLILAPMVSADLLQFVGINRGCRCTPVRPRPATMYRPRSNAGGRSIFGSIAGKSFASTTTSDHNNRATLPARASVKSPPRGSRGFSFLLCPLPSIPGKPKWAKAHPTSHCRKSCVMPLVRLRNSVNRSSTLAAHAGQADPDNSARSEVGDEQSVIAGGAIGGTNSAAKSSAHKRRVRRSAGLPQNHTKRLRSARRLAGRTRSPRARFHDRLRKRPLRFTSQRLSHGVVRSTE